MFAPNLRNSPARSPMRSLSLALINSTPVMTVEDCANSATTASVGTQSLIWLMSTVMPLSF